MKSVSTTSRAASLRKWCSQALLGAVLCAASIGIGSDPSYAADPDLSSDVAEIKKLMLHLKGTVERQQREIEELKAENRALQAKPAAQTAGGAAPAGGNRANPAGLSAFNPEIGVVADIVANSTQSEEDLEGNDKISVREVELMFGHDIDPYSRFDSTFTLSDFEDPTIEEAYVSHWGLEDVNVKLGRMRQKLGFATSTHRDQLFTVDEPLVVQRYLGVEGLYRTGLELSAFLPLPWESVTHELIGGVMEGGIGEEGEMFGGTRRRPSYYAALRNFWEISDHTSANLNATWLTGSADDDSNNEVQAFGAHARLVHEIDSERRFTLLGEGYFQDRDEPFLEEEEEEGHLHSVLRDDELEEHDLLRKSPYGYYALADLRFSKAWSSGLRFDYVEPTNLLDGEEEEDLAYSGYLTFHQSEFARWRLQYQYLDAADGDDDNRLWLQGTFAIGVHKHQLQ